MFWKMLQQNVLRAWLNRFQLCFTSRRAGQQPQKWPTRHIVLSVIIINGAFSVNIPHKKCPDFENPSQRGKAEGLKKIRGSLHKDSSSIGGPVTDWLTRSLTDCSGLRKRLSVWILVLLLSPEPIHIMDSNVKLEAMTNSFQTLISKVYTAYASSKLCEFI